MVHSTEKRLTKRSEKSYNQPGECPASTCSLHPRYSVATQAISTIASLKMMFEIFEGQTQFVYLDETAQSLLDEARTNYARLNFVPRQIARLSDKTVLLATRCGTIKTTTLAFALQVEGFEVQIHDGFLEAKEATGLPSVLSVLAAIAVGQKVFLFENEPNLLFEKFHPYLTPELLQADALSSRLDEACLADLCAELLD